MTIIDRFGNPIKAADFAEPQSGEARLAHLHKQFSQHPARGLTPARLNEILEAAELGDMIAQHELFEDMEERDAHIFSELSKRKRAVIRLDWTIEAPRNASAQEQKLTEAVTEMLSDMQDFESLQFDALDAISHGFSALELEWQRVGTTWMVERAHHRPQSWFMLDRDRREELRLRDHSPDGAALTPFGWIVHQHKAKSGYLSRSGLARVLVWPYLFKHFSIGDLAEFLDIYGLPILIGKHKGTANDDERATLWRAVAGLGHNARGVMPDSMSIEALQAASGNEKPFETMLRWCERSQSNAIVGNTLAVDTGSGGIGSGKYEVGDEVREDIRDSDAKQLSSTITQQLIYPLLALNFGWQDIRRTPRFKLVTTEPEDLNTYAESLPKLVSVGVKIPATWANEKLRIPLPKDGEAVLGATVEASKKGSEKAEKPAALTSQLFTALSQNKQVQEAQPEECPLQIALDEALDEVIKDIGLRPGQWLKTLVSDLSKAQDAEGALQILAQENPELDDTALIEALSRILFVSELLGISEVAQEVASDLASEAADA